jgi:hypothetical protein
MGLQLNGRRTTILRRNIRGEELHAWINWRLGMPSISANYRGVTFNTTRKFSGVNPSKLFKSWWPKWARGLNYRDTDPRR